MIVKAKKDRELILIRAQNTQNENKAETIEIDVPEEYESYNKKIVFITKDGTVWDIIQNNEYKITNAITKYKQVDFYIWLTKDDIDFRSKTKTLKFYDNIDASDEITPEEIHGVNTVVNILEEEIDKVENLNIEAEKAGKQTTITITKKDGTTQSVNIIDGQDGQDGKDGQDGQDGQTGQDGKDAKINGKNSIEIEAGNNITIDNTENGIRINSTGGSSGTSNYNELTNKPKINNVELSGNKSLNDLGIQPAGDYALESEIPDVSNFITNSVSNLLNYYLKSETYTKTEINTLIGQISSLQFQVVNELPQTGDSKYIYLVPSTNPKTKNVKDEYIWTNNAWEQIGSTQVDLTGYATESWVNTQISGFLTQAQIQALITTALTDYAKTEDIPTNISELTEDSTHRTVTDTEKTTWNNKAETSDIPDVSNFITKNVNDLTYYYTKTEVDGKVSAVYKYKGTVATYSDLPSTGLNIGDAYNVEKADSTHGIKAGDNVAWNGTVWDVLSGTVDLSGYQTKITSSNKISADLISDGTTNKTVTSTEKNTWDNKQNAISDLSTIRSGASAGATAVQPSDLATVATSGSYNDLSNKPSEVTESTVSGWGFTKNTGTYSKPSGGIPKTDLASAVQTSLGKADTALQSISSSDVTSALGYTPYNSTNPNGYTSNVGTITGITMNGSSKGTSGVVNLGTVITAHQDISGKLDTSKVKNANSTTAGDVYDVRYINNMIGDVETILSRLTTGGGV